MLEIKNIYKTFNPGTINEKVALNGLSLKLNEGDFVTVIGGNGAGKSTMLNAVAGVWPVDEGQIIIDGTDVTKLSEYKRAAYLGRVFQDPMTGTAATMGIEENLALAKRRGKTRFLRSGITKAEREEYKELLKILNLGLETLPLRVERHCENALAAAKYLQAHEKVAWVSCPMLEGDKHYALAKKYMPNGTCGVITFGLKGGREEAVRMMDSLKMIAIVTHVADARSCVLHPASHTHRQMNDQELKEAGVQPDLIRFSVGIENIDDIIEDLDEAFKALQ